MFWEAADRRWRVGSRAGRVTNASPGRRNLLWPWRRNHFRSRRDHHIGTRLRQVGASLGLRLFRRRGRPDHIRFRNGYRLVGPRVCWHDAVPSSPLRELGAQPFVPARRSRVGLFPPRRLTSLREPAGGRWAAPGVISFADSCPAASAATPVIGKGALVAKDVDKRRQVWRKTALSGVTPQGPPEQAPGPPEQRSPRRPSIPGCCKQPWN